MPHVAVHVCSFAPGGTPNIHKIAVEAGLVQCQVLFHVMVDEGLQWTQSNILLLLEQFVPKLLKYKIIRLMPNNLEH